MFTAALVEVKVYLRNPQLVVVLFVIPLTLVALLSTALDPVYPGSNPYQSTVPGFAVMFGFYGTAFAADAFFRERLWGNWPRLLSLPTERWRLMAGKGLAPVLVVSLQLALLLSLGAVAYGVKLGAPVPLAAMVVATSVAGCAGGLALAGWARSHVEVDQLANLFVIGLASVGGAIVPVSRMPAPLRVLAPVTPQYWALEGFRLAMSGGSGLGAVAGPVLVLLVFAALAHAAGQALFRVERMVEAL